MSMGPAERDHSEGVRAERYSFPLDAQRIDTHRAEVYLVDDFMDRKSCEELTRIIRANLRASTLTNPDEPDKEFRTSNTCDLDTVAEPLVQEVNQRICQFMGIDQSHSEPLQGQYYQIGEQFKPHTDYFEGEDLEKYGGIRGQRTWTFMVYLEEPTDGGATLFASLKRAFRPRRGCALFWNNLYPDGRPNPFTMHYATPVEAGTKTVITKWFRENSSCVLSGLRE